MSTCENPPVRNRRSELPGPRLVVGRRWCQRAGRLARSAACEQSVDRARAPAATAAQSRFEELAPLTHPHRHVVHRSSSLRRSGTSTHSTYRNSLAVRRTLARLVHASSSVVRRRIAGGGSAVHSFEIPLARRAPRRRACGPRPAPRHARAAARIGVSRGQRSCQVGEPGASARTGLFIRKRAWSGTVDRVRTSVEVFVSGPSKIARYGCFTRRWVIR